MENKNEENMVDIDDIISEAVEKVMQKTEYSNDSIIKELDKIESHKKALNNKKMKIGESLVNSNLKVSKKFKKITDVIDAEHICSFYFDLIFYGFVDYEEGLGILVKDSSNFYLKITSRVDKDGLKIRFKEELYATEEIIQQVINYEKDTLNKCP